MATEQTATARGSGTVGAAFSSRLRMPTAISRLPRVLSRTSIPQKEPAKVVKTVGEVSADSDRPGEDSSVSADCELAKPSVKKGYVANQIAFYNARAKPSVSNTRPTAGSSTPATTQVKGRLQQPSSGLRGAISVMAGAKTVSPPSENPTSSVSQKGKEPLTGSRQAGQPSSSSTGYDGGHGKGVQPDASNSQLTPKRTSSLRTPHPASSSSTAPAAPGSKGIPSLRRPASFKEQLGSGIVQERSMGQPAKATSKLVSPARTPSPQQSTPPTSNTSTIRSITPQAGRPSGLKRPTSYSSPLKGVSSTKAQSSGESNTSKSFSTSISSSMPSKRQLFASRSASNRRSSSSSNSPSPTPPPSNSKGATTMPSLRQVSVPSQSGEGHGCSAITQQRHGKAVTISSESSGKSKSDQPLSYQVKPTTIRRAASTTTHTSVSSPEENTTRDLNVSEKNSPTEAAEDSIDGQSVSRPPGLHTGAVSSLMSRTANLSCHAPKLPDDAHSTGDSKNKTSSAPGKLATSPMMNGTGSEIEGDVLSFDMDETVLARDISDDDDSTLVLSSETDDRQSHAGSPQRSSLVLPLQDTPEERQVVAGQSAFNNSREFSMPSVFVSRDRSASESLPKADNQIVPNDKDYLSMPKSCLKMTSSVPELTISSSSWSAEQPRLTDAARPASPLKSSRSMAVRVSARKSLNSPYGQGIGSYWTHSMPGDSILMTQPTPTPTPPSSPLRSPTSSCSPGSNLSSSLPAHQPTVLTTPTKTSSSSPKQSWLQQPSSYFRHAVSMAQRRTARSQSTSARNLFNENGSPGGKGAAASIVILDADTYRQMQTDIKTLKALLFQLKRCLQDNDGSGIAMMNTPTSPVRPTFASEDTTSAAIIKSLQREMEEKDHKISAMQHQLEIWQARATATP